MPGFRNTHWLLWQGAEGAGLEDIKENTLVTLCNQQTSMKVTKQPADWKINQMFFWLAEMGFINIALPFCLVILRHKTADNGLHIYSCISLIFYNFLAMFHEHAVVAHIVKGCFIYNIIKQI